MKEMLNQDIRKIEDRELRWLCRYEQIIAWHKAGGFKKAAAAYHTQIAEAERQKAVAELRVAQINVIETAARQYDGKAVRNAQIAQVAAQHRVVAADRQAINEAVDEVMALEDIIPADDIDDILAEVSRALGIELPTEADKADICQRGAKTMKDLKRELGLSMTDPAEQMSAHIDTEARQRPAKITRQWILDNMAVYDTDTFDWLDQHYPEAEDGLDEETLDSARLVVGQPLDAGKTLAEIGFRLPEKVITRTRPKIDVDQFGRILDEYKTAVASCVSVNTSPCQVTSDELMRRRKEMYDHEHRLRNYVETGEIRPLGDGRVVEGSGIKFIMRVAPEKPQPKPAHVVDESLLNLLMDWHEAGVKKLANSRPQSAFHGASDLYLEGVDALRYAVKDYRKAIIDYVFGRDNADVNAAMMATSSGSVSQSSSELS